MTPFAIVIRNELEIAYTKKKEARKRVLHQHHYRETTTRSPYDENNIKKTPTALFLPRPMFAVK